MLEGRICLCVNTDILEEYEEILAIKTTPEIARNIVEAIANLSTTVFQNTYVHFELLPADSDDNKFVDCAVASDAEYIVNPAKFTTPKQDSAIGVPWVCIIRSRPSRAGGLYIFGRGRYCLFLVVGSCRNLVRRNKRE